MLTAKHAVNDEIWNVEFKMIAPPIYKCEVITHSRVEGEAKLKEALSIIRRVMKENQGHFKQKSQPTIIGDKNKNEPDVADLIDNMRQRVDGEDSDDIQEDNDEGMGDIDLNTLVAADGDSDEEETEATDG